MAAKSEAPAAAAAAAAAPAPATPSAAPVAAAPAAGGGFKAWLPVVAALVLAPAATWATVEFLLVPRLQKKLTAAATAEPAAAPAAAESHGKEGKEGGKEEGSPNYEFQNVVVNLAGTMGTRYLKTSFIVTGSDSGIKAAFDSNKARLTDVTLNVLSSLTLADLEEPGAKNVIREKLVTAYNQALGHKVAEQVYFSDFVIQ